jgi:hypothetical protein
VKNREKKRKTVGGRERIREEESRREVEARKREGGRGKTRVKE